MIPAAEGALLAWVLVWLRTAPIGLALAVFARGFVPLPVALSLCGAIALGLAPPQPVAFAGGVELGLAVIRELCIGGTYALALSLALESASWVLSLSDAEETRAFLRGRLAIPYALTAAWLAFELRAPAALIGGLAEGLAAAPLPPRSLRTFALGVVDLLAASFVTALGLALPLLVALWLLQVSAAFVKRAVAPRALPNQPALGGVVLTLVASLALVPIVTRTPEAVRAAIESARSLTRALAR